MRLPRIVCLQNACELSSTIQRYRATRYYDWEDDLGSDNERTYHSLRRADVDVGVAYSADIDRTREVLTQAAQNVPLGLDDPAPAVVLLGFGPSAVNWSVQVWARADQFGDVRQATIRAVKVALDEAGIAIPFPRMDVHVVKSE